MRKDLIVCLDSFSGVEKNCYCIENTSKTFSQCPSGKFKPKTISFQKFIHTIIKCFCATGNICKLRPTFLRTKRKFFCLGPTSLRTKRKFFCLGLTFLRTKRKFFCLGPTSLRTKRKFFCPGPTSLRAKGKFFCLEPTSLRAAEKYLLPAKVCSRTLHCWNRPYF